MRAIVTATITFGLVSIPVKVCTAVASNRVHFNLLTMEGQRVAQQLTDPTTGEVVEEVQKGYEFAKGQYVTFTAEELKELESTDTSKAMEIQECLAESEVSSLLIEKTYYLAPNKGGDKGYALLARTLKKLGRVAIAQWTNRGREHLVAIRAHGPGLLMQQLFYAEEVRPFELEGPAVEISSAEEGMAIALIKQMNQPPWKETWDNERLSRYEDRYAKRVRAAVEAKILSATPIVIPSQPKGTVMDLFTALKASLEPKEPEPKTTRKKASTKPAKKRTR